MLTAVVASLVVQHQNISTDYIRPTLNARGVITDIAVLFMRTNDIINSEVNKVL